MAIVASAQFIVSKEELKLHLDISNDVQDGWLDKALASITKRIESYCNRHFKENNYTEYKDGVNRGFIHVNNPPITCLSGNSKINMPCDRGKYPNGIPIKKLVGKKDFKVYAYDIKNKKITLGHVNKVWKSGRDKVYQVDYWWTSKKFKKKYGSIKATANHQFLLRDGTYKKLKDLKPGDSLMPFKTAMSGGRVKIFDDIKYVHEHRFVIQETLGRSLNRKDNVHHKDGDILNNNLDNLELMSINAHSKLHSHDGNKTKTMFKKGKRLGKDHPRWRDFITMTCVNCKKSYQTKPSSTHKYCSHSCYVEYRRRNKKLASFFCKMCNKEIFDIPSVVANKKYCSKECVNKSFIGLKRDNSHLKGQKFTQTPEGYYNWLVGQSKRRGWSHPEIINRFKTKQPNESAPLTNHKIVSIKEIGYEDVYDAEVATYHNFAVNGIIVHNSVSILAEDSNREFGTATQYASNSYVTYDEDGRIELLGTASSLSPVVFPTGQQNVKIVYTGGYSDMPEDVKMGCVEWIGRIYKRKTKKRWNVDKQAKGDKTIDYETFGIIPPEVKDFIHPYRFIKAGTTRRLR